MPNQPIYVDLDEVSSEVEFTLKLDGVDHVMQEPTVKDFITNMKEIEALALNATPIQEFEMSVNMILRSFPSIQREQLEALRWSQLQKIFDYTMSATGQKVEKKDAGAGEGADANPQPAN